MGMDEPAATLDALVLTAGLALVARALADPEWRASGLKPFAATIAGAGVATVKLFTEEGLVGALLYLPLIAFVAGMFGFGLQGPTERWHVRELNWAAAGGLLLAALSLAL